MIAGKVLINGTVMDSEGIHKISVSNGGMLVFSFIGYQTLEQPVTGKTTMDISLVGATRQLSEVVVTAQGILKTRNE